MLCAKLCIFMHIKFIHVDQYRWLPLCMFILVHPYLDWVSEDQHISKGAVANSLLMLLQLFHFLTSAFYLYPLGLLPQIVLYICTIKTFTPTLLFFRTLEPLMQKVLDLTPPYFFSFSALHLSCNFSLIGIPSLNLLNILRLAWYYWYLIQTLEELFIHKSNNQTRPQMYVCMYGWIMIHL